MIFRDIFRILPSVVSLHIYRLPSLYPLDVRALLYNWEDIFPFIDVGSCLIMEGGWWDLKLIYKGSLPDFVNGDRFWW